AGAEPDIDPGQRTGLCFLNRPVRWPTSAGTNENASRPALPTRSVSADAGEIANKQNDPARKITPSRCSGLHLSPQSASKTRVNALMPGRGRRPLGRRVRGAIHELGLSRVPLTPPPPPPPGGGGPPRKPAMT